MTSCLLSLALVLTPAPLTAPKEAHSWVKPADVTTVVSSQPISSFDYSTLPVSENTALFVATVSTAVIEPPPEPPPPILTPIEQGLNRLSELGATPYQLRVFGCLAWYESSNRPWVVSATNDHGLWQISARFHRWRWAGRDIYDPIVNAEVAWDIYRESGFRAWTTARLCGV